MLKHNVQKPISRVPSGSPSPLSLLFLAPRSRRSRKTAGPGTQFLPGCKRCIEASSLEFAWCGVFLQEMLSNVSQTQTFAVGTNWRELVQKQQAASRWKVLCEHPRYVHFENIVIATFEYFKKWFRRLLHALRHLFSQRKQRISKPEVYVSLV